MKRGVPRSSPTLPCSGRAHPPCACARTRLPSDIQCRPPPAGEVTRSAKPSGNGRRKEKEKLRMRSKPNRCARHEAPPRACHAFPPSPFTPLPHTERAPHDSVTKCLAAWRDVVRAPAHILESTTTGLQPGFHDGCSHSSMPSFCNPSGPFFASERSFMDSRLVQLMQKNVIAFKNAASRATNEIKLAPKKDMRPRLPSPGALRRSAPNPTPPRKPVTGR